MKIIKSKGDLPDWFFIRQYRNNLTLLDWYYEIQWRLYCMELAKNPKLFEHAKSCWTTTPDRTSFVFNQFNHSPPKPVADFTQFNLAFAYFHEFENPHSPFYKQDHLKKHLVYLTSKYSHNDFKNQQNVGYPINFEICKQKIETVKGLSDFPPLHCMLYNDMFCGAFKGMEGFPISVNLHYDDSYLVEQFKEWLANIRKIDKKSKPKLPEKNPISDNQINHWVLGKFRQMIDLDYWARWGGVRIGEELMIDTIWSNGEIKTKDSLKETRRQYRKVFTYRTLQIVINQIKVSKQKENTEE